MSQESKVFTISVLQQLVYHLYPRNISSILFFRVLDLIITFIIHEIKSYF